MNAWMYMTLCIYCNCYNGIVEQSTFWDSIFSKEIVLFGRLIINVFTIGRIYLEASSCILCREIALINLKAYFRDSTVPITCNMY